MTGILEQLKGWWMTASYTQKGVTLGGVLLLIGMIAATFSVASSPRYELLYGGLSEVDQAAMVTELQNQGIPAKYDKPGTIEVPTSAKAQARMALAMGGKLPRSSHVGNDDLSKMNLMTTPSVERERLKAIAEGELAKSIETLDGVTGARIHVNLGNDSPFADQSKPATASVTINQASGITISGDQGRGIAQLVANAVPGLDIANVVVLNQRMDAIYNGQESNGAENIAERKIQLEEQYAKMRQRELQGTLDAVFGAKSTMVLVRAELDLDEERATVLTKNPSKDPLVEQTSTETMAGSGRPGPGGVSGINTNTPAAQPGIPAEGSTGGDGYKSDVQSREWIITKEKSATTRKATGSVKSMSINVIVNSANDNIKPDDVRKILDGEIATKLASPETASLFKVSVTPVAFDTRAEEDAKKAASAASQQQTTQQAVALLPVGALILVALIVLKQLGKIAKNYVPMQPQMIAITPDGQRIQLPAKGVPMSQETVTALQSVNPANLPPEVAQMIAKSSELANELNGGPGTMWEEDSADPTRIHRIRERVHIPLEQIKKLAVERPEVVAMIIRMWISDEGNKKQKG